MRKFECLLFVLKRSYICYYMICMTVPLIRKFEMLYATETKDKKFHSNALGCITGERSIL